MRRTSKRFNCRSLTTDPMGEAIAIGIAAASADSKVIKVDEENCIMALRKYGKRRMRLESLRR
jgi:hypothetical protein